MKNRNPARQQTNVTIKRIIRNFSLISNMMKIEVSGEPMQSLNDFTSRTVFERTQMIELFYFILGHLATKVID